MPLITRKLKQDELLREDGRVEWICPHGVGHPIGHISKWMDWMWVHGCDGCCLEEEEEEDNHA